MRITNESLGRQLVKVAETEELKQLPNFQALIIARLMEKERLAGIEEGTWQCETNTEQRKQQ